MTSPTMTVAELAARVGIDPSTAYRYLVAGQLPGVQVGQRWVIDRERVERFVAGKEDAAGRVLVDEADAPATRPGEGAAVLTVLPGRAPDARMLALGWLQGAHAALALLVEAAGAERSGADREVLRA
jgi:excisionase family DNA binding protein